MSNKVKLILPGVNLREIWRIIFEGDDKLWTPPQRISVDLTELRFDQRLVENRMGSDRVVTHPDQFDAVCSRCQSAQCQHFMDPAVGCFWCRREFTGPRIGIPVAMIPEGEKTVVHLYGRHCSYNCAYADLREKLRGGVNTHPRLTQSETYLLRMFARQHPGERLVAAPHWTLLRQNGGELSDEQFDDQYFTYQPTPQYLRLGVHEEYHRKVNR